MFFTCFFERSLLFGRGFLVVLGAPFVVGHAVDGPAFRSGGFIPSKVAGPRSIPIRRARALLPARPADAAWRHIAAAPPRAAPAAAPSRPPPDAPAGPAYQSALRKEWHATSASSVTKLRCQVAAVQKLKTSGPEVHQSGMARICRSPHSPSPGAAGFLLPVIHFLHEPAHRIIFTALRDFAALGQGPTQELLLPPTIQRHLAFDDRIVEFGVFLLDAGVVGALPMTFGTPMERNRP